jgi:hypothetical protein
MKLRSTKTISPKVESKALKPLETSSFKLIKKSSKEPTSTIKSANARMFQMPLTTFLQSSSTPLTLTRLKILRDTPAHSNWSIWGHRSRRMGRSRRAR